MSLSSGLKQRKNNVPYLGSLCHLDSVSYFPYTFRLGMFPKMVDMLRFPFQSTDRLLYLPRQRVYKRQKKGFCGFQLFLRSTAGTSRESSISFSFVTFCMDISRSSGLSWAEQETNKIPLFHDEDLLSMPSDSSSGSSRGSSLLEKSFSFGKRGGSKEIAPKDEEGYLTMYMKAWSNFKPCRPRNCLPYDEILTANNPFMTMSPYRLEWETSFSNLVSMMANSVRREMADMFVYILPSLIESSANQLSREECHDLRCWWNGFAEYLFTILTTVAKILQLQQDAVALYLDRLDRLNRRDLTRELKRTMERLTVTSEIPMKAMHKRVSALADKCSHRCLVDVEEMWCCFSSFILLTLDDSYSIAKSFEQKSRSFMASGLQEKLIQGMLTPPRLVRSIDAPDYTANIVISLTRWMRDDEMASQFVARYFKKKVERNIDAYCFRYVNRRRISKFQFDRKPADMPKEKRHTPTKVKFADA